MSITDGLSRSSLVAMAARYRVSRDGSPVHMTKAALVEVLNAWYEAAPLEKRVDAEASANVMRAKPKNPVGFALLSPLQRSEMARVGGQTAHARGRAHKFTSEEAVAAGKLSRSRKFYGRKEPA